MGYEFNSCPPQYAPDRRAFYIIGSLSYDIKQSAGPVPYCNGIDPALCCSFHHIPSLSSLVSCSETQIQKTLHRNRDKFILAVNQRKSPGELGFF